MKIIFDTDIFSIAQHPDSPEALIVRRHLIMLPDDISVGTTIISYDEQTRGWFKYHAEAKGRAEKLKAYVRLFKHLKDWQGANVFPFDEAAMEMFDRLVSLKLRVGSNDLKIAATVLAIDGTLVTRNVSDFNRVPKLRVEDWTKP